MDNKVALQADVSSIPQSAVLILGALTPILRALSADSVNPLAVCQVEEIGRYFPISGPLAGRLPDVLTRSRSIQITRLKTLAGWMPGDTATTLAQTAGGQAAALLTVCLVEMFCRNSAGHLLFELSMRILPRNSCLASMDQLSDLAEIMANKLRPLAFGQHHAVHITRIRETYFNSGIEVPPSTLASLLDRLTVDAMVDLLDAVQQALQDETVLVRIEGFQGLGSVVSLLMALCPNDVILLVEDGVISKGQRSSIVVSVKYQQATSFHTEKVLRSGAKTLTTLPVIFRDNEFLAQPGRLSSYDHLNLDIEGCMARMVEQLFINVTVQPPTEVTVRFVDLIGAIMCSFNGTDFGSAFGHFPQDGWRSVLGHPVLESIRGRLAVLFGTAPPLQNIDPVANYGAFRQSVGALVPEKACECSQCLGSHIWATLGSYQPPCRLRSIWGGLQDLVGQAVLLCLVDTDLETLPITQFPRTKMGRHLCHRLLIRANLDAGSDPKETEDYSVHDIHHDLCALLGTVPSNVGPGQNILGTSSGATSIFPSTLEMSASNKAHVIRYRVVDGQFHDGRSYYKALVEKADIAPRALADKSILQPEDGLGPSHIGAHSDLTLSVRPAHNSLALRAMVTSSTKVMDISFHDTHLAYMAASVASPCDHNPKEPVALSGFDSIIASGVEAPVASGGRTSVVLTHGDIDAQFLAGVKDVPTLFQGSSCLCCMICEAKDKGFRLLIQS